MFLKGDTKNGYFAEKRILRQPITSRGEGEEARVGDEGKGI